MFAAFRSRRQRPLRLHRTLRVASGRKQGLDVQTKYKGCLSGRAQLSRGAARLPPSGKAPPPPPGIAHALNLGN